MDQFTESNAEVAHSEADRVSGGNRTYRVYLALFAGIVAFIIAVASLYFWIIGGDHFTALNLPGKASWYRDLGGNYITEIQDQDLFFHDIGRSIDYLRRADVIILGSSLVSFAINGEVIREQLEEPYRLKFYNMAFVGIASGEFSKKIIEKYDLHPRLWIINADDGGGGGGNFFARNLSRAFGADVKEIPSVHYGKTRARYEIIRRNFRWIFEDFEIVKRFAPPKTGIIPMFYRSDKTGAADMSLFPYLLQTGNPNVKMIRDPDCHTSPEIIANARDFVHSLGAPVVLTLVPNFHGCLTQMYEIAQMVGIEVASPDKTDYSSWDNGGHLDRIGSIAFTNDLVTALEKTSAFQALSRNNTRRH